MKFDNLCYRQSERKAAAGAYIVFQETSIAVPGAKFEEFVLPPDPPETSVLSKRFANCENFILCKNLTAVPKAKFGRNFAAALYV